MEIATVKNFYEENTDASDDRAVVPLPNVLSQTLAKIIDYCTKQVEFRHHLTEDEKKKKFSEEFVSELNNDELRELIDAANYLNVPSLLNILNENAASRIKNKSVEFVRKFFGIENDFTPEEEQAIRDQHPWAYEGVDED
ncbi:SKP1-like protein 9 [Linum perenne]